MILIDIERFKKEIADYTDESGYADIPLSFLLNTLSVVADEIVECKDCKYNYANMIPNGKGCQRNVYIEVDDNFFCADGKREKR